MPDTGRWDPKDPDEIKDYEFDWSVLLDGDTISSSVWSVVSGSALIINNPADSHTDTTTTFWASAGLISDGSYQILNRITTAGGRTYDRTRKLKMKSL